jgi:hypothetical protein
MSKNAKRTPKRSPRKQAKQAAAGCKVRIFAATGGDWYVAAVLSPGMKAPEVLYRGHDRGEAYRAIAEAHAGTVLGKIETVECEMEEDPKYEYGWWELTNEDFA